MVDQIASQSFFTDLVCSLTGESYDKNRVQTYSKAHKPLSAKYHIQPFDKSILKSRPDNMWRYREMLPILYDENIVSLGEGMTPLLALRHNENIFFKDESINPTGSFKARGLAMAVSKAKELGIGKLVIPTAGNAGGALSAYCARAVMECHVFMPRETPEVFKKECELLGAKLTIINGNISDCAKAIRTMERQDWFDVSTLKEPYRLEGKKTMGYEIAEQLNWKLPDVIIYPTGGGTGLIGIWKALKEMEQLGWIAPGKRPRMVVVQTEACYPIVRAWENRELSAAAFQNPAITIANGLRVPQAFGDRMILDLLLESKGYALTVSEKNMRDGVTEIARKEGVLLSPEGSAVWMAYKKLSAAKWIHPDEKVVLINTGSYYKYLENLN